jgi:hypothetical protein
MIVFLLFLKHAPKEMTGKFSYRDVFFLFSSIKDLMVCLKTDACTLYT